MNRGNQILAALLVAQIAIAVLLFWPRSTPVASDEPFFPGVDVDQIAQVTIDDLEEGQLRFTRAGEGWVLADADGFPLPEGKVPALLDKLLALTGGRFVTETRASHERLKVADDDYMRRVDIVLDDNTLHTLYVGTSPTYGVSHVRVGGQDQVYLVSDLSSSDVEPRPSAWVDTSYLDIDQSQAYAMSLENAHGRYVFTKDADGNWTLADLGGDETFKSASATSLLSRVGSLRLLRPLGQEEKPSYGLDEPSAVIAIHVRDENGVSETYTLHVGAQSEEDKSFVVKSSTSPYYVRVAEYTMQEWVDKTRDDLLDVPATPVP